MDKLRRALLFVAKALVLTVLLVLMGTGWLFLLFIQGGGLSENAKIPIYWVVIDILLFAACIAFYVFIAVTLSKLGRKTDCQPSRLKRARYPLLLAFASAVPILIWAAAGPVNDFAEKRLALYRLENADVVIEYQNDLDYNADLLGTGLHRSTAIVDRSTKRATFIFHVDYDKMRSYKLKKGFSAEGMKLQFTQTIGDGWIFSTYYSGDNAICTEAVALQNPDGTVWGKDIGGEWLDFNGAFCDDLSKILTDTAQIVPYSEAELPPYAMGVEHNSVVPDMENGRLGIVYGAENNVVYCRRFTLNEVEMIDGVYVQAEVPLGGGATLYAYAKRNDYATDGRTDGMAILTAEGRLYECAEYREWGRYGFENSIYAVDKSTPRDIVSTVSTVPTIDN